MINQLSNNKPSGYQSIDCDAGVPISGRTASNGSYQILKVSDAGSLLVASSVDPASVDYQIETIIPVGTGIAGAKASTTFLGSVAVIPVSISAGTYTVSPSMILEAVTGGTITLLLVKAGTVLDAYSGGLIAGTDPYTPSFANYTAGGLACVWHNLALNTYLATNIHSCTGGNNNVLERTVYLQAGAYNMICIVDTAITTAGTGQLRLGINSIIQIA